MEILKVLFTVAFIEYLLHSKNNDNFKINIMKIKKLILQIRYLLLLFAIVIVMYSSACSQNSNAVKEYSKYVNSLKPNNFRNITLALNYYQKHFNNLSQEEKDYGYLVFREFYYKVDSVYANILGTGDPNFEPENKIYHRCCYPEFEKDVQVIEFKKSLAENGFTIGFGSEPGYFLSEFPGYMLGKFENYVSPVISDFLKLRDVDLNKPAYYDVYIWITETEMGERIKNWDKYIENYPNSPLLENAKNEMNIYLNDFLGLYLPFVIGNPASDEWCEVFDTDGKLLERGKTIYLKLIDECGNSNLGNLLREYYEVLEKTGFIRNSVAKEFLRKKGFEIIN